MPLQPKIYIPLIVAFLTVAINYGTRGSFGIFLKPFEAEFGASRATISSILSITLLTYSALAFFTGYLSDRVGARVILLIGGFLATVSFMISGFAGSLLQVTLSFGIIFGAATCFLSQITALSLLVKLPSGGSSLALGIIGSGPAVGSLILVPSISGLIAYHSWRFAMQAIGWLFLGYLLLTLLLLRKDGKEQIREKQKRDGGLREILFRGRNLSLLCGSFSLMCLAVYGVLSQEAAYAIDRGMTITRAGWALGLVSGSGVVASPLLGWLSDRVPSKKNLGAWILASAVVGVFFIFIARSWPVLALGSIIVGIAYACYAPIYSSLTRSLFGPGFFGRAWGFIATGGSIGAALGSWLGGYLYDLRGNYNLVWLGIAVSFLAASLAMFLIDITEPEKKEPEISHQPSSP